jgi:hypothetical protein
LDGISCGGSAGAISHCVLHNNNGDGIEYTGDNPGACPIIDNCIFTQNNGYGLNFSSGTEPANIRKIRNNAFGSGTTWDNDLGTINGYTNSISGNVTLGTDVDPYTASGSNDYTLNTTAGGGAACRNAGTNNTDIGYYQHSDPAGGSGGMRLVGRGGLLS